MQKSAFTAVAIMLSFTANAADFTECHEYSTAFMRSGSEPAISENGLRADWIVNGQQIGCRVDSSGRFVSLVTSNGEMRRNELVKVSGPLAGKIEYSDSEDDVFVKASIDGIKRMVKDPDSIKFRELFISNGKLQSLCGEVNGKNSYGAYIGFRRFYYTGTSGLNEIENPGDSVFAGMYPRICGAVRKQIPASSDTPSAKAALPAVAEEISKLDNLRQKGILTIHEFESQKQKLLSK